MSQAAAAPAPSELVKRCPCCEAEVQARVSAKNNHNKGRWYYACNSCTASFFCWGDYRPGFSEVTPHTASQIFSSQPEQTSMARAYTMSFDKVLSGEEYTPAYDQITMLLYTIDSRQFGIRAVRYNEEFVTHLKLLNYNLRKWDDDEKLWRCPVEWYTQIVGHMLAAGYPVDSPRRRRLEAHVGVRASARAAARLTVASQRERGLARRLFDNADEDSADDTDQEVTSTQRHDGRQVSSKARSRSKAEAADSPERSKRSKHQEQQQEEALCVVCMRDEREYTMVPCGHYLYCATCAPIVARRGSCALCRQPVERHMRVYT